MRKSRFFLALLAILGCDISRAGDQRHIAVEDFVTGYHARPAPERVPAVLDALFARKALEAPWRDLGGPEALAHAFGHMARGNAKLVREYESRFPAADGSGQTFLLRALQVCGDDITLKKLEKWSADPGLRDRRKEVEAARTYLADAARQLPRARPARDMADLDFLLVDFLVTGDYAPVSRLLDVLDRPGVLRPILEGVLRKDRTDRVDILKLLDYVQLIEPGTKDKLVAGDLDLRVLHDANGHVRPAGLYEVRELVKDDGKECDLELRGTASLMLQENRDRCPRLKELLRQHYPERPPGSRELVKKWLRIDQPRVPLDEESRRLQGTWQAIDCVEDDGGAERNVALATLRYRRWTFDADELRTSVPATITSDGVATILGHGGVLVADYKVDASKNPKVLIRMPIFPEEEEILRETWIYKTEGDLLQVCACKGGGPPKEFTAGPGSNCVLLTLKKVPER